MPQSDKQMMVSLRQLLEDLGGPMYAAQVEAVEAAIERFGVCSPCGPCDCVRVRNYLFCPACGRRLEVLDAEPRSD